MELFKKYFQADQSVDGLYEAASKGDSAALAQLRALGNRGDDLVQFILGTMYETGDGFPQDSVQAVFWYRKSADQGHAGAQASLGLMYANGIGVPQDSVQAVFWYRKSAEQGDALVQSNLGLM